MTLFDAPKRTQPFFVIAVVAALSVAEPAAADDLFAAAKRGDLFSVRHYLKKDPGSVQANDASGYTALHWAAIRGRWEMFEELIAAGAPVGAVGRDGGTPLHWACHHDRPDMVRLLLDAGADLTVANQWGRRPLHVAVRRGCDLVASLLLARGADPNAPTREGWTPLHVAYMAGQPRLVRLLLDAGAATDRVSEDGQTPAECAFERPAPVSLEPSRLEEYVGRYALGPEATVKVWQERGRLHLMEFAPDELYAIGADLFFCRQEPWRIRFLRGEDGHVDAIELRFLRRTVTGRRLPEHEYVGSARCAECHLDRERGAQYLHWLQSRHGLAYWRLATGLAKFLASRREQYRDIEEPIREWRCLKCHTTGAQDEEARFAESFAQEEGVGCEACHGPGSAYMAPEIMEDRELFLRNGGRLPTEQTCRECHQDDRFRYEERLVRIAHPRPRRIEDPH
jgi:nitrate/TMAO reductase-like tetraheme cytochrome c subunit